MVHIIPMPIRFLILTSLILGCHCWADDWPMLGHDAARSGGTSTDIRPPFARKWYRLFPDEGIQSGVQPVIAEGKVFLGTLAGVLHAMSTETGKDLWTFQAAWPILHAAAVSEGKVFFGGADGVVYALNAADGKLVWSVRTGAAVWNAPAVHSGLVLIGSRDGRLYALEAATGKIRWATDTGAPRLASALAARRCGSTPLPWRMAANFGRARNCPALPCAVIIRSLPPTAPCS
ncbi:MAG: PQQ-binding-like beta-propeller repeat protein [Verrucomicrobia bacterium]|nr:PQQ-binding-like beta-propeller repeat protein [Verrucomicrobiota bacterium]